MIIMELNILDVTPILTDTKTCINFLRGRNLLLQDCICCYNICAIVQMMRFSNAKIVDEGTSLGVAVSGKSQNYS